MVHVLYISVVFSYFCLLLQSSWPTWYLFINCRIANHICYLGDIQVFVIVTEKSIFLFSPQKRLKCWLSGSYKMIHDLSSLPKTKGSLMNFELQGASLHWNFRAGGRRTCYFFAHKLLYKNLTFLFPWIYIS